MSAQHAALQSTVASCLTAILGTDQSQRKAAEDELKALEVTEGLNRNRLYVRSLCGKLSSLLCFSSRIWRRFGGDNCFH